MPKLHEKPIIRLEQNEVYNIIDTVESGNGLSPTRWRITKNKVRDSAILMLFLGTGIRISELVGLNNEDLNFDNNSFIVTRKGGNKSILYFDSDVAGALMRYIDQKDEQQTQSLEDSNALFLSNKNAASPCAPSKISCRNTPKSFPAQKDFAAQTAQYIRHPALQSDGRYLCRCRYSRT